MPRFICSVMKILTCIFILACTRINYCLAQASFAVGVKGSFARVIDTGGLNQIGNFLVVTEDVRNKPMAQAYVRLRWKDFYLQPEFRYSTFRFYTRYENIDRENPKWEYYNGIGSQNLAGDQQRIDIPLKLGYFVSPRLSVSAGILSTFFSYTQRSFVVRDGRKFLIADNVFDSHKKQYLGGTVGLHYHKGRINVSLDYDQPFKKIHNPVLFNGEYYGFNRTLKTYALSIGFDCFRSKTNSKQTL